MSVIEAASVGIRTMADGTLRLSVDIEPRHAQAAFALFGSPGTPMALAALRTTQAPSSAPEPADPTPKPDNALSRWVAIRCSEDMFQRWLCMAYSLTWKKWFDKSANSVAPKIDSSIVAANVVRDVCEVKSRADFDSDPEAAKRCHERIRGPYSKHLIASGLTA